MKIRKFNEHLRGDGSIKNYYERPIKQYTEDEVINLIKDYYVSSLGNFDPNTDEERNFTNPNGRNYIDLDRIKSRIVDFMKDK